MRPFLSVIPHRKNIYQKSPMRCPRHVHFWVTGCMKWHEKWPCCPCFSVTTGVTLHPLHLCRVCPLHWGPAVPGASQWRAQLHSAHWEPSLRVSNQCLWLVGGGLWRPKAVPLRLRRRAPSWPHLAQPRWLSFPCCV